jgi:hypothetical protein
MGREKEFTDEAARFDGCAPVGELPASTVAKRAADMSDDLPILSRNLLALLGGKATS